MGSLWGWGSELPSSRCEGSGASPCFSTVRSVPLSPPVVTIRPQACPLGPGPCASRCSVPVTSPVSGVTSPCPRWPAGPGRPWVSRPDASAQPPLLCRHLLSSPVLQLCVPTVCPQGAQLVPPCSTGPRAAESQCSAVESSLQSPGKTFNIVNHPSVSICLAGILSHLPNCFCRDVWVL